ncbi:MAG: hypothetical protein COX90_00025 [Candidatus Nealsonbacteria bacterium CG_4_10_14_0_2_um_filter_38_17]|uniref:Pycsar effector protein domain-containing protein n=1 Tax=Candidatus Nealsonbacteria bacterium CG_4_10_14_0_2_um_filter_38_17 TaxID=1974680 RepID=A0A2M7UZ93_9BACT|nr:MAG: hypothetical protein COX90_00025 [Candidatus Nealsonbacteria bacterium CG_4_10_14_0_2_um_filter_38_17]
MAIFIFSASIFQNERGEISLPFLTLALFSIISTFVGLFAIHPFRFMRKRGQEESLMYNKEIISFPSFLEYAQELKRITNDKEAIINQYAKEIYNICKYYYRPKRELFHLARRIFIIGFALSSLFFIIELF